MRCKAIKVRAYTGPNQRVGVVGVVGGDGDVVGCVGGGFGFAVGVGCGVVCAVVVIGSSVVCAVAGGGGGGRVAAVDSLGGVVISCVAHGSDVSAVPPGSAGLTQ